MKKKKIVTLSLLLVLVSFLYSSKLNSNNYADERLPQVESIRNL